MVLEPDKPAHLLRVLMLGEIYSRAGRKGVAEHLPRLRQQYHVDLVIANAESAAGGHGLTGGIVQELLKNGIDVITSGNRIFDQREMVEWLRTNPDAPVLRPLNYPAGTPGKASFSFKTTLGTVEVLNLNGRIYFNEMDSPFRVADQWLEQRRQAGITGPVVVDFHAEATSEKVVLGWYLDGKVSAVLGTHTRTPTADARLLPGGTAHVSDVGMVGPDYSVAGLEIESALKPFVAHYSVRPRSNKRPTGPVVFNSVLLDIEPLTGKSATVTRLDLMLDDNSK
jgi:metallophosphoesterase (TIGR00282 family)